MEPLPLYRVVAPFLAVAGLVVVCVVGKNPRLRITLLGVGVMIGFGVVMDQVSARLCPEYFTAFHNPIPGVTDPTLLGLLWGFLAAWWGGVALGYSVGLTATLGSNPPLGPRKLVRPMLVVVAGVAGMVVVCGAAAYRHADLFGIRLAPWAEDRLLPGREHALFAVACYHFAAYTAAVLGSIGLCVWVGRERRRRALNICTTKTQ